MNISSKRARQIAILAFVLNLVFFFGAWILAAVTHSIAVGALCWQILGSGFVNLILVIVFHQRFLVEQEKLDMAQLAKTKHGDTIFQASAERTELFATAQKRLKILEKWFIPGFGLLLAAFQITIGFVVIGHIRLDISSELRYEQLAAVLMASIAFVSFLISRYATGMSAQTAWKPLRAGGSSMLATAILAFGLAIGLALAQFKILIVVNILMWATPIVLVILGTETALNTILDIYRPRIAGQYSRMAFDSRLLGIFNEPGGILHTFASAIDYQFGFKVSQTWFYKLLEEAILPLVLFAIVTLYLLSCILVVEPGEQAIVERFGGFHKIVDPGLALKLPWPFDVARREPTKQIQVLNIGFKESAEDTERKPLLWGEAHYEEEDKLLVAAKWEGRSEEGIPVSIVIAAVPVQYRINDLYSYTYKYSDSKEVLRAICYRELVKYAASARVETDEGEGVQAGKPSLLGAGRKVAADYLTGEIQRKVNEAELGVEIVYLGLQGVHPPPDVAKDYQDVIAAVQKRQAAVMVAQAEQNRILISLCGGSVEDADALYEAARKYQDAKESDSEAAAALGAKLNSMISEASGEIFTTLSRAKSDAFERSVLAEARGVRFAGQVKAFNAANKIYVREQRLSMLEDALQNVRKYVVLAGDKDTQVFVVDLQEELQTDLFELNMDALKGN